MGTKAALDEVLFLFLGVVLSPLCVDDGCVCVGRIICSFGFVSEVCTCKGSAASVTLWGSWRGAEGQRRQKHHWQRNWGGSVASDMTRLRGQTCLAFHPPAVLAVLPLCLAKYRPKMMSRQSMAKTTTATTPPTTAWSTLLMAPSSPARESVGIRRAMRIGHFLRCSRQALAAAALGMGRAALRLSRGAGGKHGSN